jgi:predicted RNase H-like HicB family nuclease
MYNDVRNVRLMMKLNIEIYITQDSPEEGGLFSAVAPRINWAAAYGNTKEEAVSRLVEDVIPLMIETVIEGYNTNEIPEYYLEKQDYDFCVA